MGFDADILNLFSNCLRVLWINMVGIVISLVLCNALMERKSAKHLNALSIYVVLKMIYTAIIVNIVLRHYFEQEEWWFFFHSFTSIVVVVINFWMFYLTFRGTLVKILGGIVLAEMIAMPITFAGTLLVNIISKRTEFLIYADRFYTSDLLLGMVIGGLFLFCYPLIVPILKKYRKYQIRHSKIVGTLIGIYTVGCQMFSMTDFTDPDQMKITVYLWASVLLTIILVIMAKEVRKYKKQIQNKRIFLEEQQRMMEKHYQAFKMQERWMEKQKDEIAKQMQSVEKSEKNLDEKKITEYLEKLRETYEGIQTGIYCNEWKIDALLYCQGEILKRQKCKFECFLQEYDRGTIREADLLRLLNILLNHGILNNRGISDVSERYVKLKMAAVKNQLLISFCCSRGVYREIRQELEDICRRYEGCIMKEEVKSGLNLQIMLRR